MGKPSKRMVSLPIPADLKAVLTQVKHITKRRVWDRAKQAMVFEEIAHYTPVGYGREVRWLK